MPSAPATGWGALRSSGAAGRLGAYGSGPGPVMPGGGSSRATVDELGPAAGCGRLVQPRTSGAVRESTTRRPCAARHAGVRARAAAPCEHGVRHAGGRESFTGPRRSRECRQAAAAERGRELVNSRPACGPRHISSNGGDDQDPPPTPLPQYSGSAIFLPMGWTVETLSAVDAEIETLPVKLRARLLRLLETIETSAWRHSLNPMPSISTASSGNYECGPKEAQGGIARGIYVTQAERRVVVLHVFAKKSRKTPLRAFAIARERMKQVTP